VTCACAATVALLAVGSPLLAAETLPPSTAAYVEAVRGCSEYSDPIVAIRARLVASGWTETQSGFEQGDGNSAAFVKAGSKLLFVQSGDGNDVIWSCTVTAKLSPVSTISELNSALSSDFQGFSTPVYPDTEYMIFPKGARPFQVKFVSTKNGLHVTTIFVDTRKRQKQ
jgi:hypothetical protein